MAFHWLRVCFVGTGCWGQRVVFLRLLVRFGVRLSLAGRCLRVTHFDRGLLGSTGDTGERNGLWCGNTAVEIKKVINLHSQTMTHSRVFYHSLQRSDTMWPQRPWSMMTSSNGNICRVTGPLWGESSGHWWIPLTTRPVTRSCDVFYDLRLRNGWANSRGAGDVRCHRAHQDFTVMSISPSWTGWVMTCLLPDLDVKSLPFCSGLITLRPRQDGRHFTGDIFKCIFLNEDI